MSRRDGHRATDDQAVRAVETANDQAWDAGDLDGLLACLADDAVVVNPLGEAAEGVQEVRARLGAFLDGQGKGSTHQSHIQRVRFATRDVAVVDGEAAIQVPGGGPMTHRFTDVLVRQGDAWRIAHVRAYDLRGWTASAG